MNLDQLKRASEVAARLNDLRNARRDLQGIFAEKGFVVRIGKGDEPYPRVIVDVDAWHVTHWLERLEAAYCDDLLRMGVQP